MKFKKKVLATLIAMALSPSVMSQNIGFEDGNATGWTGNGISAVGSQTLQAGQNQWTVNPYGSYMGKLTITSGTFSQMATALDLTSASTAGIQSTLSSQATATGNGQGNPTTASWTSKTVTLTAGQQFTLAWQYISTDYVPFNDGSIATLVKVGSPSTTAVLNNYTSQYALLGFTNPGTGDYSTGSYGSTGWQTATYTVTESGDYLLGFGVFNLDDTALSPILYVDEVTGTTMLNGTAFGAVAPNAGTSAPDTSGGSVTPPVTPPTGPVLVSNVTGTTGSDLLASGNVTVNGGTIQIVMSGATLTQLFDVQSGSMTVDQNSNSATLSGVISGVGDVVIANSGTGGSITFTAVNTYTGSTTINSGATLINDGSIASSSGVTNAGTFTNNGTAGNVTNTGTFTNTGTAGNINNSGTVDNSGTVGAVTNTGWFTNALNAVAGYITNSNVFTNNGTTGSVSNTGTFTNNGTTGNVTNDSTFTNAGTTSDVINAGTFNNTGTVGPVLNQGTFNTSGTTGAINNTTGSVTVTGGNVESINNTGTFTMSGGTLGAYTQASPGTTVVFAGQPFVVSGAAALGGGFVINNSPTAYGKYPVLSAGSVDGKFDSVTSSGVNDYLKYSGTDVKLYVTPSSTATQSSIGNTAGNLSNMNNLQSGVINNSLGNDCNTFGDNGACISVNFANTAASTGDLTSGGVTVAKRINDNWKAGVFTTNAFNNPTLGDVKQTTNPAIGGFVGWNQNVDGTGFGLQGSAVANTGKITIARSGPETGVGTASTTGQAVQLKGTYSHALTDKTTLTDYIGIRHTKLNVGGYTETGPVFPLTVNGTQQTTTDLIAGVGGSHKFTDKLSGNASVGIVQNLSNSGGNFSGTSEIGNLQTFNTVLPASKYTSAALGAGLSYEVGKDQRIGVSVGWQQKGLTNADVTSYGLSYTAGF